MHHEGGARVQRGQGHHLERVEHAKDVELPLLREVGGVGEESEGHMHPAKLARCHAV